MRKLDHYVSSLSSRSIQCSHFSRFLYRITHKPAMTAARPAAAITISIFHPPFTLRLISAIRRFDMSSSDNSDFHNTVRWQTLNRSSFSLGVINDLTPFECKTVNCSYCMKTYLVCRVFKRLRISSLTYLRKFNGFFTGMIQRDPIIHELFLLSSFSLYYHISYALSIVCAYFIPASAHFRENAINSTALMHIRYG